MWIQAGGNSSETNIPSTHIHTELNQWPAMLVIDAILGSQFRLSDYQEEATYETLCSMIRWTRKQASPVLSIDFPSGVDGGTGTTITNWVLQNHPLRNLFVNNDLLR